MRKRRTVFYFRRKKLRLRIWIGMTLGTGIALLIIAVILILPEHSQAKAVSTTQNTFIDAYMPAESGAGSPSAIATTSLETPFLQKDAVTCAKESTKKNEDVIGWIRIEGTLVDYPVVQTQDDNYYLTHDAEKEEAKQGAIFLDYRCDPVSLTGNNILFGHNMKDGSMFASLTQYKDEEYYQSHPMIEFATLEKAYQWEIFAVVITDTSYDYLQTEFENIEKRSSFMSIMQEKSLYETVALPSGTDDILILSTCTYEYDDARLMIAARRTSPIAAWKGS